jgi:hypothetical protein
MKKMVVIGIAAAWIGTAALHAQTPAAQPGQKQTMSMEACKQMMSRHQQMISDAGDGQETR